MIAASTAFAAPISITADEQKPSETIYIDVMGDRLTRVGGQLYVTDTTSCPANSDFPTTCSIRSRPTGGGLVTTLFSTASVNDPTYDI